MSHLRSIWAIMAISQRCLQSNTDFLFQLHHLRQKLTLDASPNKIPSAFPNIFDNLYLLEESAKLQQSPPPRPTTPKPKAAVTRSTVEDFLFMERRNRYTLSFVLFSVFLTIALQIVHRDFFPCFRESDDCGQNDTETSVPSISETTYACIESTRRVQDLLHVSRSLPSLNIFDRNCLSRRALRRSKKQSSSTFSYTSDSCQDIGYNMSPKGVALQISQLL